MSTFHSPRTDIHCEKPERSDVTSQGRILSSSVIIGLNHGCANHATEEKCFCPPSTAVTPRSLPTCSVTNYVLHPLHSNRLYVYTVCCRRGGQYFSVLRTRHTDVVVDSSGRSYVTEQGHNVPLLRTRGIGASSHPIPRACPVSDTSWGRDTRTRTFLIQGLFLIYIFNITYLMYNML